MYSRVEIAGYVKGQHIDLLYKEEVNAILVRVEDEYKGHKFVNLFVVYAPKETMVEEGQYIIVKGRLKREMTDGGGCVYNVIAESITIGEEEK